MQFRNKKTKNNKCNLFLLEFNFRVRISRAVIISVLLYLYIVDQLLARKLFSPHDTFAPRGLRFSWDFVAFCVLDAIVRPQVIKGVSIWFYFFFFIENTYWSQKVVILYHVILTRKVDLWYFSWVVHSSKNLLWKSLYWKIK